MKILPLIKAELKKNLYIVWVSLFTIYFILYMDIKNILWDMAYYITYVTNDGIYFNSAEINLGHILIMLAVTFVWVLLLAFIQFGKDYLNFKKALPYKLQHHLFSKAFTALVISVISAVFYGAVIMTLVNRYGYIFESAMWRISNSDVAINVWLNSAVLFAIGFGVYAYVVFFNVLFKHSFWGCACSAFTALTAILSFSALSEAVDYNIPFYSCTAPAIQYAVLVLAVVGGIVFMILSCCLYGKGYYVHPLYKFKAVENGVAVLFALFGGAILYLNNEYKGVYYLVGLIIGLVAFIILNKLAKKGWKR